MRYLTLILMALVLAGCGGSSPTGTAAALLSEAWRDLQRSRVHRDVFRLGRRMQRRGR